MQPTRLRERVLRGNVVNVDFADLVRLVTALGFREVGGRGSHRVFARAGVTELLNPQEEKASQAVSGPSGCHPRPSVRFAAGGRSVTAYSIEVFWSDEDQIWIADVPDLPHCTAHGASPHEAVAEVELAAEAWLDAARATGRPIPEPSPPAVRA